MAFTTSRAPTTVVEPYGVLKPNLTLVNPIAKPDTANFSVDVKEERSGNGARHKTKKWFKLTQAIAYVVDHYNVEDEDKVEIRHCHSS